MRTLLIVVTGFVVGAGAISAAAVALPDVYGGTAAQATHMTSMGRGMSRAMMSGFTGGGSMMGASPTAKLTIQHVQRGCHVWSNGKTRAAMMRLHLKPGQTLSIMDMDVDAHQMMEFAGPMHLRMGGPMMMNHGMTLTFTRKGVYRLGTKTVEMPGGMTDVKTIGPDNKLRLVVTVA